MSTRAISAWLTKEYNIQLSYTSVARALRESKRRLLEFGEEILEIAFAIEPEHEGEKETIPMLLYNEDHFRLAQSVIEQNGPVQTYSGAYTNTREQDAVKKLECRWFVLDQWLRDEVLELLHEKNQEQKYGEDCV